jgi:hypothetical protein
MWINELARSRREMKRLAAMKRRHHKESNVFTTGSGEVIPSTTAEQLV